MSISTLRKRKLSMDSSSSMDDEELFRPTFVSHKNEETKRPRNKKERKMTNPTTAATTSNGSNVIAANTQKQSLQDTAQRMMANAKMIPSGISHSSELVWYKYTVDDGTLYYYIPCRVCEPNEARFIGLEPLSWDTCEVCLVQALVDDDTPFAGGQRNYTLANRIDLQPYHGSNHTNTSEWCPQLWNLYIQQRQEQARKKQAYSVLSQKDLLSTRLFLQRILQHAQEREYDSQVENTSSDDYDDDDKEHQHDTNKTTFVHFSKQDSQLSIASDELEVPYAENLLDDDDDDDYLPAMNPFSEKQTEPLRPGDVIEYTCTIFTAGDKRGQRTATVLSTDPHRTPRLVLDNGDVLPPEHFVKRIHVLERGQLFAHLDGYARPIDMFRLEKSGTATVVDGLRAEGQRVGDVVDAHFHKFTKQAKANGFAPMDLFHKRSKPKHIYDTRVTATVDETQKRGDSETKSRASKKSTATMAVAAKKKDSDSETFTQGRMQSIASRREKDKNVPATAHHSDSSLDSDASVEQRPKPRLDSKRLISKLKEKGLAAFDSDNESDHDNRASKKQQFTKNRPKAAPKTKKAPKSTSSKPISKKTNTTSKATGKASKDSSRKSTAKKTGGSSSKAASRKSIQERNPVLARPGEWMTTRRNPRESLGIDSDVTSLASVPSNAPSEGRSSPSTNAKSTGKSSSAYSQDYGNNFSQDTQGETVVVVKDCKDSKRKLREDSLESGYEASCHSNATTVNETKTRQRAVRMNQDDPASSSDDSSLGESALSKHRSNTHKSKDRSPMQETIVVDLANSPPRKSKSKRASYGSRGKSRVEIGLGSSKRRKISSRNDSLSFHSSSSDESAVEMEKYHRREPITGRGRAKGRGTSREETFDDSSDSSIASNSRRVAPRVGKKDKSPVLDLTGDDSDDSSIAGNRAPRSKQHGTNKQFAVSTANGAKKGKAKENAKPFGLSLTKHNVRRKNGASKKSKDTAASKWTAAALEDSDGFDSDCHRKKLSDDLGDWGTYRGDATAGRTKSSRKKKQSDAGKDSRLDRNERSKEAFVLGSQSTDDSKTSPVSEKQSNLFAKNAGDDEIVDSSDDNELLFNSQSQSKHSQSLPRRRLFQSSQWKSGASHGSFATAQRIPVAKGRKDRY